MSTVWPPTFSLSGEGEVVVEGLAPGDGHDGDGVVVESLITVEVGRHHPRGRKRIPSVTHARGVDTCGRRIGKGLGTSIPKGGA